MGEQHLVTSDGRHLYVEPRHLGVAGDQIMIAGTPNYASIVEDTGTGEGLRVSDASGELFFGAFFDPLVAHTLPLPPGAGPVRWVYGARLDEERRGFVMEATDSVGLDASHRAILYAELGTSGWESVEALAGPEEGHFLFGVASEPTPDGEEIVWAVVHSGRGGMSPAIYRRIGQEWHGPEILDVSSNTLDVVARGPGDLDLVVGGLDPALDHERATLRLYPGLQAESEYVIWTAGEDEQFQKLRAAATRDGAQAAWLGGGEGRQGAWVVSLEPSGSRQPLLMDAEAQTLHPVGSQAGWALWLTSAADPLTGSGRLRLHLTSATAVERLADIPNPYIGFPTGILSPSGEIVVVGPEAHFETTPPFVRSLVLRFSLTCTP